MLMLTFARRVLLVSLFMLLMSSAISHAQNDNCPVLVQTTLELVDDACADTGRNQACYGHTQLIATPRSGITDFAFEQAGDIVNVDDIAQLRSDALSSADDVWGVALLLLQANLPDTQPGQNVTVLLFGDTEITNAVGTVPTLAATATVNANVRQSPSTNAAVLMALTVNQDVTMNGISDDGQWVRIAIAGDEGEDAMLGWVFGDLLATDGDISTLNTVAAGEAPITFTPMQAFYLKSGIGTADCAEVPRDGALLQTPAGGERVELVVNDTEIVLGSTVYLQAQENDAMTVTVIEGYAKVTSDGVTEVVPAGTQTTVPLDGLSASGAPTPAEPYIEPQTVQTLPVTPLERDITIAEPLPPADIPAAIAAVPADPTCGVFATASASGGAVNDAEIDVFETFSAGTVLNLSINTNADMMGGSGYTVQGASGTLLDESGIQEATSRRVTIPADGTYRVFLSAGGGPLFTVQLTAEAICP